MNRSIVRFVIGRVFGVFAILMALPLLVSLIYREPYQLQLSWLGPIAMLLILSGIMLRRPPENQTFYAREGMVICALLWLLLSFFGGLPLYLSGEYPSLTDAFFEISSGLTTTGASVAHNVELLSHSILFWRSFTHLIGGMGVLVLVLALFPHTSSSSVQMAKAEMPGPTFGKVAAKLSDTARILYTIYFGMTAILVVLLLLGGMPLFDALCHAFGTAGTGGFGIKANSIHFYGSAYIEWVLTAGMLVFAVNMNLYYFILARKVRYFLKDEELHWFLAIVLIMIASLSINILPIYQSNGLGLEPTVRNAAFSLASLISTTGYTTADYATWPLFSRLLLLTSMLIGGCGGSTAGGFKVSRIAVTLKAGWRTLTQTRHPRRIVPLRFNGEIVKPQTQVQLHGYIAIYVLITIGLILLVSLDPNADTMETAISSVFATFNNVGPGMGAVVGPTGNYAGYHFLTKILLSVGMIAGRLEIWPILILLTPKTWRKQ